LPESPLPYCPVTRFTPSPPGGNEYGIHKKTKENGAAADGIDWQEHKK
jgi:hypothetical protein